MLLCIFTIAVTRLYVLIPTELFEGRNYNFQQFWHPVHSQWVVTELTSVNFRKPPASLRQQRVQYHSLWPIVSGTPMLKWHCFPKLLISCRQFLFYKYSGEFQGIGAEQFSGGSLRLSLSPIWWFKIRIPFWSRIKLNQITFPNMNIALWPYYPT